MSSRRSRDRLIDASLNRAAEGLRVAEDICRFHWNLRGFSGELKELRHELLALGRGDPARHRALLEARDSEGDVGRAAGVAGRTGRTASGRGEAGSPPGDTLAAAAFTNLERAREALRTLEETRRDEDPEAAGRYERIRYALYSLERGLARVDRPGGPRRERLARARLYLLATTALCRGAIEETVARALRAGVDMVQLREKSLPGSETLRLARSLRELTARENALFIVNDRPDLALLARADGVHLGQDDLPVAEARAITGDDLLIGVSTHSLDEARRAHREGADYIGIGPFASTRTKDTGPPLGARGFARILAECSLPAFAIGGIDERSAAEAAAAGAERVAVSSAILSSEDVEATVAHLRGALGGSSA